MAFRAPLHAHEPIQPSHPQDDGAGAAGPGDAVAEIQEVTMTQSNHRLTYRSQFGDYGFNGNLTEMRHEIANRLGAYEDLGSVEDLRFLFERFKAEQAEAPLPLPLDDDFHIAAGPLDDDGVDYALALEAAEAREEEQWDK